MGSTLKLAQCVSRIQDELTYQSTSRLLDRGSLYLCNIAPREPGCVHLIGMTRPLGEVLFSVREHVRGTTSSVNVTPITTAVRRRYINLGREDSVSIGQNDYGEHW